jgi:hypothetical protein
MSETNNDLDNQKVHIEANTSNTTSNVGKPIGLSQSITYAVLIVAAAAIFFAIGFAMTTFISRRDNNSSSNNSSRGAGNESDTKIEKQTDQKAVQTTKGAIRGMTDHPATPTPKMKVCSTNIANKVDTCVDSTPANNQTSGRYEIQVEPGDYQIYAAGIYDKNNRFNAFQQKMYYNKFVTECLYPMRKLDGDCAINPVPESLHTNVITVKVEPGKTVENINPWDWYYNPENYKNSSTPEPKPIHTDSTRSESKHIYKCFLA